MSIINEALKKTEEYLQKNSAQNTPLPAKPATKPYLLYILILLAGLFLGNFIFSWLSHKIQATQTLKKYIMPVAQTTNPLPIVTSPSQPAQEIKPKEPNKESLFVLNGIFFSDNDGYALVNNQIVRKDDFVDEMTARRDFTQGERYE